MKPEVVKMEELRKQIGMSRMSLANVLGVSLMSVNLWVNGGGNPSPKNMKPICAFLARYAGYADMNTKETGESNPFSEK